MTLESIIAAFYVVSVSCQVVPLLLGDGNRQMP
jgi:hypothetical protein